MKATPCCHPADAFQVAELLNMDFYPDQLQLLFRTGVLAGVHGAGLTNQVWMTPGEGAVVELWHGMADNFHYHNMAQMLGHAYYNVMTQEQLSGSGGGGVGMESGVGKPVNVSHVVEAVGIAMDEVARRWAARRKGLRKWWKRLP
jgi:hypothetical protein